MSGAILHRCGDCRDAGLTYCDHYHVLTVYVDGAEVRIKATVEARAREIADALRIRFKGKPFHRPRYEAIQ